MFNSEIFKAYDIRGIYQQDFDDKFAYDLGRAFVLWLKKEAPRVFVAGDMRLSTPQLKEALISGLLSAGAEVLDGGLLSTPTFYFGVSETKADGGLIVSASHNPKEWNGFKITKDLAKPLSLEKGLDEIKDLIFSSALDSQQKEGSLKIVSDILDKSMAYDLASYDLKEIKAFKVVADASNSMGAQYLEALFNLLPAKLVPLNFRLDGSFPVHEADPLKEENLEQLKQAVLSNKADLGIASDGDGDRIFFADDRGELISPALLRGLLAKIFLKKKPGAKIAYDVRPGKITEDLILENGGQPVVSRVGHSLIKDLMLEQDVYFAGESSGHFFLNDEKVGCFERPVVMIIELLKEFSLWSGPISEEIKKYKKYFHSGEINNQVSDKVEILVRLEDKYQGGKISKLDGLSVEFEDFWFNVRASNTENKIRLNLEARSLDLMEKEKDKILKIIRS